jgi:hypothetical protein
MLNDPEMPKDPFKGSIPDLSDLAGNIRSMYTSFVAAGFKDSEALEITIRLVCAMFLKAAA